MEITINQNENQLISISNNNLQQIGIEQDNNQIINVNNTNAQDIDINQNDNQTILIDGGGAVIGITDVLVNGVSVVSGNIAYITVPTKTSELQNNSGFITSETDPTVPSYIKQISLNDINNWNSKQNALVSGVNIKTINNESLLGSGNIEITSGESYTAGDGINITENVISNTITSYNDLTDLPTIPTKTSDLNNDSDFVSGESLAEVAFTGSYNSLSDTPIIPDSTSDLVNDSDFVTGSEVSTEIQTAIATKQDTLVSGTNIKTINNTSLLGSGNINISGGTPTDVQINGTSIVSNDVANIITKSAYNETTNKILTETDIANIAKTNVDNEFTYSQTLKGNNINLSTANSSSNDSGDIIWYYGNGNEKARIWTPDIMDNSDRNLYYSCNEQNGTNVITSPIATLNDIPSINTFKIASCTKSITLAQGDSVQTLFAPPTISGYTFIGIIPNEQGFADQWMITYGVYGGYIVAAARSFYPATLTSNIKLNLLYLENNYYNNNVSNYNF